MLAFFGALSACTAPLSGARVRLILPEFPPSAIGVSEGAAYRVQWIDPSRQMRWAVARPGGFGLVVTISKEPGTPVLAYPLLGSAGEFGRPAGAVFPDNVEAGERLVLSFRSGFLAERYSRLIGRGVDVRAINTAKLVRRIDLVAGTDPWTIDAVRLEKAIADRSLSADSVRSRESHEVKLALEPGVWLRRSWLAPTIVIPDQADSPADDANATFPEGYHQLLRADGREVVAFTVGARGVVSLMATWPRY